MRETLESARMRHNAIVEFVEHGMIPFEPKSLRGEKLLVLAPHPDDEVIACGGLIAQHVAEGRHVQVLIASDGAAAAPSTDIEQYRQTRQAEAAEGLTLLGAEHPRFLGLPDRGLETALQDLKSRLRTAIEEFRPDLIAVPSPVEIHPDHQAVCRALFQLVEEDDEFSRTLALTSVAFYEVSQPIRPNLLLDITSEAEKKWKAIAAHVSQTNLRAYQSFARGLNQYRAMTLPPEVLFAEAYAVFTLSELRLTSWNELVRKISGTPSVEVTRGALDISVIIRTRNRLGFLEEALQSVESNGHPARIVVVNDGGESPQALTGHRKNVTLIEHQSSHGRSAAMNAGVQAASSEYIAFLDDDDRYYPDHLQVLANAASLTGHAAYYTDALSVFLELDEEGKYQVRKTMRIFEQDFDPDLLLVDNYIPLPTVLLRREDFLQAGGFDPSFDLFEDWDFLIRLSRFGSFLRIPRLTCEIRHLAMGDSVVLSKPEGTQSYRDAKLRVWKKHRDLLRPGLLARVFETQKLRARRFYSVMTEERGRASHLEHDVLRLDREKKLLLAELETQTSIRFRTEEDLAENRAMGVELQRQFDDTRATLFQLSGEAAAAISELEKHQVAVAEQGKTIEQLYGEIERLNEILESVYRSKTWKLHQMMQSVRGKNG